MKQESNKTIIINRTRWKHNNKNIYFLQKKRTPTLWFKNELRSKDEFIEFWKKKRKKCSAIEVDECDVCWSADLAV